MKKDFEQSFCFKHCSKDSGLWMNTNQYLISYHSWHKKSQQLKRTFRGISRVSTMILFHTSHEFSLACHSNFVYLISFKLSNKILVEYCCYRVHYEPCDITTEQWHLQPSEAVAGHPPAWSVWQLLLIWNIVWRFPQRHWSLVAKPHFLWQDAQWPQLGRKWFIFDQYCCRRSNPGCRIVGSSTTTRLNIANFSYLVLVHIQSNNWG